MAVRCPLGCRPELGGPWIPAFAGRAMREFSARLSPPRFSDSSALSSFPPRKRGPRSHSGAAATGMDLSAADIPPARCLSALERKHLLCRGGCGGSMPSWLPSRARWSLAPVVRREAVGGASRRLGPPRFSDSSALSLRFPRESRGGSEPRWCRSHGADLSAAGSPPARCLSALERKHPPCRGGCGGSMSFWLPSRARWSLGRSEERRVGNERVCGLVW